MTTGKIDMLPDEAELSFIAGDGLYVRFEMGVNITGRTYTAGITDCGGNLIKACTCTISNAALGYVDMTLTEAETALLQTNGKKALNYSWYFTETNAGFVRTWAQGPVKLGYK